MSTMGVRIDQFNKPVCNSFKAKIFNGQVCYEVDLSKFATKEGNLEQKLNTAVFLLFPNLSNVFFKALNFEKSSKWLKILEGNRFPLYWFRFRSLCMCYNTRGPESILNDLD